MKTIAVEPILTEEFLEYLAKEFLEKDYRKRYGISFAKFVEMKNDGTWEEFSAWNY